MRYLKLAIKNTTREKKRSLLLAGAIAFGLSVILVVSALGDGLISSFLNQQSGMITGHVVLKGFQWNDRDQMVSLLDRNDSAVKETAEFYEDLQRINFRTTVMASLVNGSNAMQQMVIGIDAAEELGLKELLTLDSGNILQPGDKTGVLISKNMADELSLKPGDMVMLKTRTLGGTMNVADFTVTGVIADNLGVISDLAVFCDRSYLNQVLDIPQESATEVHLFLNNAEGSEAKATRLWEELKNRGLPMVDRPEKQAERNEVLARLGMEEWDGIRYHLTSLEEDYQFIFVIGGFLSGTAMIVMITLLGIILVGVGNTLRMMIYERRKEIGTLRALGMQRGALLGMLVSEMQLVTLLGIIMGTAFARIIGALISRISFPDGHSFIDLFLYRNHLTLVFDPARMLITALTILILVAAASYFPARKAAKTDPAKAIHSIH